MDFSSGIFDFGALSQMGYYLALRVGFAYPVEEQNAFPEGWVNRYTTRGYMLSDPVMHWVYNNSGATRWSEIDIPDTRGVLVEARRFNLNYGVAISICCDACQGQRSFGSFARADREFTDAEISVLSESLADLHAQRCPPTDLTRAELEALRMVKDGLLMKEIAGLLGVTEGAVKQRLRNAKTKLRAKTSTHAATMATTYGLI